MLYPAQCTPYQPCLGKRILVILVIVRIKLFLEGHLHFAGHKELQNLKISFIALQWMPFLYALKIGLSPRPTGFVWFLMRPFPRRGPRHSGGWEGHKQQAHLVPSLQRWNCIMGIIYTSPSRVTFVHSWSPHVAEKPEIFTRQKCISFIQLACSSDTETLHRGARNGCLTAMPMENHSNKRNTTSMSTNAYRAQKAPKQHKSHAVMPFLMKLGSQLKINLIARFPSDY